MPENVRSMIRIGTSGWVYRDWRLRFYPRGVAQKNWLNFYVQHFDTVELNATTYRLPLEAQIETWCAAVPPDFKFTVKLSRLITHRKSLPSRVDEFIFNYFERMKCFRPELVGQILCQFPPFLQRDDALLERFLRKLPATFRYVVEFRHRSWLQPPVYELLRRYGAAFCIHDYPGVKTKDVVTTEALAYVRFHGYTGLYRGSYPRPALRRWAARVRALAAAARDVYVYFNNDYDAAAIGDARTLRALLQAPGRMEQE